jgi:predicted AlkP superfamily pyrophosphatase or phosphodiesterase
MNATQRPHGMGKLTRSRMRTLFHSAVLGIAGATISAPAANGQSARITVDRSKPMVVVISLDAFGAESLKDPFMPAPTLRMLMAKGAYARSMRPVNPTITWPNHTAMVTGVDPSRSFVMANGLIQHQREAGATPSVLFEATKAQLIHVPTVYDIAHAAGMTTAQADWVAIHEPGTIDYPFEERPDPDNLVAKELINEGAVTREQLASFRSASAAWRDQAYAGAAAEIIRNHHPNLTLVHFLALDEMEHMHGFDTEEAKTTIGFLDGLVKQIVDAVQDAGDTDRTTFIIVSDHGQMTIKANVQPNALLRQANISSSEAEVLPEAGIAYVYIRHGEGDEVAKLKKVFDGREGIRSVITPEGFAQIGFADPKVNPQSPDMVLFAQNGYSFVAGEKIAIATLSAPKGTHGYPNTEPLMQEIFIAEGHGIRAAGEIAPIANVDVAPTIARLLGLKMPDVQGQAVGTILK